MLADRDCLAVCAFRSVMAYISAAQLIGGNLFAGCLFPRCHGRRGPGPSLPSRSPFDSEPAKRSADGRAAEPNHDVSKSSGRTDVSELPLSPEFEVGFCSVCRKLRSQCSRSLGETTLPLTCGQLQIQSKRGATKYGREHRPAKEVSSNPMLTLNDPR